MPENDSLDTLDQAYQQFNRGKIKRTAEIIDSLLKKDDLDAVTRTRCLVLKSRMAGLTYSFQSSEDGLKLAGEALKESKKLADPLLIVDAITALSDCLLNNRDHFKAFPLIEEGEKILQSMDSSHSPRVLEHQAGLLHVKGWHYILSKGEYDRGYGYMERGLRLFKDQKHVTGMLMSYWGIGVNYKNRDMHDQSIDYYQKCLSLARETGNDFWIARTLNNIGLHYQIIGETDKALNFYQQTLDSWNKQGIERGIAHALRRIGGVLREKGRFDEALGYAEKSQAMYKKLGDEIRSAVCLLTIGHIHEKQYDLIKALDCYQQALTKFREKKHAGIEVYSALRYISRVYRRQGNLPKALEQAREGLDFSRERENWYFITDFLLLTGDLFREKGEFEESLDYYEQSLLAAEKTGAKDLRGALYGSLGMTYQSMGKRADARVYYQRCLVVMREIGDIETTAEYLHDFIVTSLQNDDTDTAKNLLRELQELREENKGTAIIAVRYRIASALVLKNSDRLRDKFKAQMELQQVVDGDEFPLLAITAIVNLCDLLLGELRVSGKKEIIDEVKALSGKLLETARTQRVIPLLVETYLLQSKLSLLELDVPRARQLMDQAYLLSVEKGLVKMAERLSSEQATLQDQMDKWKEFKKLKPSAGEIIDLTRLDSLIEEMVHERIYPDEEKIGRYATRAQQVAEKYGEDA